MLNASFWLMYFVGLVGFITPILTGIAVITAICSIVWFIGGTEEPRETRDERWALARTFLTASIVIIIIASALPSQMSLYAGAGQYVVETTEIDERQRIRTFDYNA